MYSTRYRNLAQGEYDISIHDFHFSPYASAEFFYNGATSSWDQEWYTAGIQWPYKRMLMIETYYLRQNHNMQSFQPQRGRSDDQSFLLKTAGLQSGHFTQALYEEAKAKGRIVISMRVDCWRNITRQLQ